MNILIRVTAALACAMACDMGVAQPVQVTNYRPSYSNNPPDVLSSIVGDGRMYFVRRAGVEFELGVSDGTPSGSAVLRTAPQGASTPTVDGAVIVAGRLYYTEELPGGQRDLWTSDGTAAGTTRVAIASQSGHDQVDSQLAHLGGVIYVVERGGPAGAEVWRTERSAGTTRIAAETAPGPASLSPQHLKTIHGRLYLVTRTAEESALVRLDEGAGSLVRIFGVPSLAGSSGAGIGSLTVAGERMYFAANAPEGRGLYALDALTENVLRLAALPSAEAPAQTQSVIDNATPVGSGLAFARRDQGGQPRWWISDGTSAGTAMIAGSASFSVPVGIAGASVGSRVYYPILGVTSEIGIDRFDTATGEFLRVRAVEGSGFHPRGSGLVTANLVLFPSRDDSSSAPFQGVQLGTEEYTSLFVDDRPFSQLTIRVSPIGTKLLGDQLLFFGARGGPQALLAGLFAQSGPALDETTHLLSLGDPVFGLVYSPLAWDGSRVLVHLTGAQLPAMTTIDGDSDEVAVVTQTDPRGVRMLGTFGLAAKRLLVGADFNGIADIRYVMGSLQNNSFVPISNPDPLNRVGPPLAQAGSFFVFCAGVPGAPRAGGFGVSDGTQAGTRVIQFDPNFGRFSTAIEDWAGLPGRVVFILTAPGDSRRALAVTDGTSAGTRRLTDWYEVFPGRLWATSNLAVMLDFNGRVWSSDGTEAGTRVFPLESAEPFLACQESLGVLGDSVYFRGQGLSGTELYATNGTVEGTRLVRELGAGTLGSNPYRFASAGGRGYFLALNGTGGPDVWAVDGTAPIARFGPADDVLELAASDERVFFAARVQGVQRIYASNGTAQTLVSAATTLSVATSLTPIGSSVLFAGQSSNGRELWRSDATPSGTFNVFDPSGVANSSVDHFVRIGDRVFFTALVPGRGVVTYRTDGTASGTEPVLEALRGSGSESLFTPLKGGFHGQFLSGYFGGTLPIEAIVLLNPAGGGLLTLTLGGPTNLMFGQPNMISAASNNLLYYLAGNILYQTDGTAAGIAQIDSFDGAGGGGASWIEAVGTKLFYALSRGSGTLLYVIDSPGAIPRTVTTIQGQTIGINTLGSAGTKAYFFGGIGAVGGQSSSLGVTDGTPAGTQIIRFFTSARGGAALGDLYIFAGGTGTNDIEPWVTTGTLASTLRLRDIVVGTAGSDARNFVRVGPYVYFLAETPATGRELYRTDGTSTGTILIQNLTPGAGSSTFASFTPVGQFLYFTLDDGLSTEIYRTNGSPGSIVPVTLRDGAGRSSTPANLLAGGDSLYFTALAANGIKQVFRVTGAPLCPADFDQSGYRSPDDLADYIACYFLSPPGERADFDGNGIVDPDDLADFVVSYFIGCE